MEIFLGLAVPVQVAIITACIGAITILLNTLIGKANLSSLKQRRYIDTISKERIEWLNKIRDSFVEFTMLTSELIMFISIFDLQKVTVEDERGKEYFDKLTRLNAVKHKVHLLLNPKEFFPKKLNTCLNEIVSLLFKSIEEGKIYDFSELHEDINFIQQVILKAEWRRVIIEIEKGKKLSKSQVEKVFSEVAKEIGSIHYDGMNQKRD